MKGGDAKRIYVRGDDPRGKGSEKTMDSKGGKNERMN